MRPADRHPADRDPADRDPAHPGDHHTTPGALRSRADRRRDAFQGDETDRGRPLTGRSGRPAVPARLREPEPPAVRMRPP
ncbi:MAG TPA: hypothetical protein VER97_00635, partial [Geodermatophilus sp.]|nr:hypothetical protein [Geodermatophilus sp.]